MKYAITAYKYLVFYNYLVMIFIKYLDLQTVTFITNNSSIGYSKKYLRSKGYSVMINGAVNVFL